MDWVVIAAVILMGLAMVGAEIFLIPGGMWIGIIGGVLALTGVYFVYDVFGSVYGTAVLAGTIILSGAMVILGFRSGAWDRVALQDVVDGRVNVVDVESMSPGDTGMAVSALRPSGKAEINGRRVEVHSQHGFIDKGREIEVLKVSVDKIIVKQKNI